MPAQERVAALHGVMTGLANLVNEQLGRLTIGPQATRLLRHLERQTFGNAGLHRRAGRNDPGLWCPYGHAAWAESLGMSASALTHLRTRLVEAGILWYTPDPERRGGGALGWNFDFAAWHPAQWGGVRAGAGRPRASTADTDTTDKPCARAAHARRTVPSAALPNSAAKAALDANRHGRRPPSLAPSVGSDGAGRAAIATAAGPEPAVHIQAVNGSDVQQPSQEPSGAFKTSTNAIQVVNERKSRRQRTQFKMSIALPSQPAPRQVPVAPVMCPSKESLKKEKKQRRRTDADASGVATTPHVAPAAPGPLRSHASHISHDTQIAHSSAASPVGSLDSAASTASPAPFQARPPQLQSRRAGAASFGDPLPPPLPYETLRTYWLRIYREASAATGKEPRDLVHAAARALLNMGHARDDYILLGRLHQAAGTWATVLHWILDGSARELADPRTYLQAIAARHRAAPPQRSRVSSWRQKSNENQGSPPAWRQRESRTRPAPPAQTGQAGTWMNRPHDTSRTVSADLPDSPDTPAILGAPGRQNAPDVGSTADSPAGELPPAGTASPAQLDQLCWMPPAPAATTRQQVSAGAARSDAAARTSSPGESGEPRDQASGLSGPAADGAATTRYEPRVPEEPTVPMVRAPDLWRVAQQRLRADLTPAQYRTWLANTDLFRTPDGAFVLLTHTTFAAELIALRWGDRIRWVLRAITGKDCILTVRVRHVGTLGTGPDG